MAFIVIDSPIGPVGLRADADGLTEITFHARGTAGARPRAGVLGEATRQLDAYFSKRLRRFDLPLAPHGTPFQLEVWQALQRIPYGDTWSYADLARRIGRPLAGRAHAYQPRFFSEIGYCSDSRGAFHHGEPLAQPAIAEGRAMQLLTHPIWWMGEAGMDLTSRLDRFIAGRAEAMRTALAAEIRGYAAERGAGA